MSNADSIPQDLDLTPYAGRWIALVRGCVTGVGASEQAARLASKHQRPKEEPVVVFVSSNERRKTNDEGRMTDDQ
jgi:hypothetical protein